MDDHYTPAHLARSYPPASAYLPVDVEPLPPEGGTVAPPVVLLELVPEEGMLGLEVPDEDDELEDEGKVGDVEEEVGVEVPPVAGAPGCAATTCCTQGSLRVNTLAQTVELLTPADDDEELACDWLEDDEEEGWVDVLPVVLVAAVLTVLGRVVPVSACWVGCDCSPQDKASATDMVRSTTAAAAAMSGACLNSSSFPKNSSIMSLTLSIRPNLS